MVENAAETWAAPKVLSEGRADFADCLIGRTIGTLGCTATATFDRMAARLPEFVLVPTPDP